MSIIYECVSGKWRGEKESLTRAGNCPICGMPVTCETDAPGTVNTTVTYEVLGGGDGKLIDDCADEPVYVGPDDPNAITK